MEGFNGVEIRSGGIAFAQVERLGDPAFVVRFVNMTG